MQSDCGTFHTSLLVHSDHKLNWESMVLTCVSIYMFGDTGRTVRGDREETEARGDTSHGKAQLQSMSGTPTNKDRSRDWIQFLSGTASDSVYLETLNIHTGTMSRCEL